MMHIKSIFLAFIPFLGDGVRFRLYLRLREYYRRHKLYVLATMLKVHIQHKYGCELSINANISPKCQFMHTVGIVIGEGCTVGEGTIIYSNVCLGRKDINNDDDYLTIGKNVTLCTGATILEKINVGDSVVVGANALVTSDCTQGSIYVGLPARRIK